MSEGFICKECNYTSPDGGNCPYCDMPLEPIDGIDETTGEVDKYKNEEMKEIEKENVLKHNDVNEASAMEDDELDQIIKAN